MKIFADVINCKECGNCHRNVEFIHIDTKELHELDDKKHFPWQGKCPNTLKTIYLKAIFL